MESMSVFTADRRCCRFEQVLGPDVARQLLEYAERRQRDFQSATVYRRDREKHVDNSTRDCVQLRDLGPFKDLFKFVLLDCARAAGPALGTKTDNLLPAEFEICAYGDGGFFGPHIDSHGRLGAGRVLTCVYYFSVTPQKFSGGQLRIHPWPVALPGSERRAVDVDPSHNTLVIFPSMLRHEVLPIHLEGAQWRENRFSLTGWLWHPV